MFMIGVCVVFQFVALLVMLGNLDNLDIVSYDSLKTVELFLNPSSS